MSADLKLSPHNSREETLLRGIGEEAGLDEGRLVTTPDESHLEAGESSFPPSPATSKSKWSKFSSKWSRTTALISRTLHKVHQKTPVLKRFPSFVIFPIGTLIVANLCIWAILGIVLRFHPYFTTCFERKLMRKSIGWPNCAILYVRSTTCIGCRSYCRH